MIKWLCGIAPCILLVVISCVTPPKVVIKTAEVNARHGLALRESPDANSKKILVIPWAEKVEVLGYGKIDITMDGITSKWARVKYEDAEGWAFGGYLMPVEAPERIRLGVKNSPREYVGSVYTEFDPSLKNMGGSMIGGRFSVSIIAGGQGEVILFNESISRAGTYIKWKIVEVFTVPGAPGDSRFIYPGLCRTADGSHPGGEVFAIVKDIYDDKCEFRAIRRAWIFDFAEKKVREIAPKNIVCRQECCGRGCL